MPALSQTAVTIFVPLVFTVVVQFAAVARDETLDDGSQGADRPPLFLPGGTRFVPSLGRLNVVHATNVALLAGCLVLVQAVPTPLSTVLSLLVAFVWLQLPILEVEAVATLCREVYPLSVYFHLLATATTATYATAVVDAGSVVYDLGVLTLHPASLLRTRELPPVAGLVMLCVVSIGGFLHLLDCDLEARASDDKRWIERRSDVFEDGDSSGSTADGAATGTDDD